MKSIVLPEGISTDFPPMDGSYWFRIGINGKREKPRFRMRLVEMRLGSIEGIWSLLNRIKDRIKGRYCAVLLEGRRRSQIWERFYCCCANVILQFGIEDQ